MNAPAEHANPYGRLPLEGEGPVDLQRQRDVVARLLVPRGAGTGLSGGALPHAGGVLLSTAKLNRIVRLDPYARTAVVEPGVRNLAITEAAAPHGLYYAPDPSSQIACTIAGNVAENSGGVHCLKYGLTFHNVLAVRGVSGDGELVEFGSAAPDVPGLDLLALVIGSEGMLAVITGVTVKLVPKPALARCIMASFDDVGVAGEAVAAIIAAGIIPAGLEMMDRPATRMVEPFVKAGYDLDAASILLVESDGTPAEVEEEIAHMTEVLNKAGARRIAVSGSEAERLKFWKGRKNAFPAAGRVSPAYYCMDGTCSTTTTPRRSGAPRTSASRSSSCRWRSAAPSPASTASAWRRSARCARSSPKPSGRCSTR
ncbi:MAG: glcD [Burkholderiaceae bacterium]|nr:glcD [Burkholderiaceae bacterium]